MKTSFPLSVALLFSSLLSLQADDSPNFVVFLADDLGWGDLACYGHPVIQTPNLDRFAIEGVRFTQAYSSCAVCSPSRSSILTGRTPYRNGVWRWVPGGSDVHLRTSEITVPELVKEHGYQTMHAGKWHLNGKFNDPAQPQPNDHRYDWWFATQNNAAPSHKNPKNFVRNGEDDGPLEGFSAPLVADEAIHWLRKERAPDEPFFMTVWTHEPHLPIESDPEFMKLYSDLDDPDLRQHHGNITQLDHAFGKLMKALDELDLREDTFVIFTSDNGPEGQGTKGRTRGSTGGLRGRKRDDHEGGIRVPAIVRWPGKIEAGSESATPMIGMNRHGVFEGGWGNVGIGTSAAASFEPGDTFDAEVTLDLEHGKAILVIGETKVEHPLPESLESFTHIGIYAKATESEFTLPTRIKP